MSELEELRQRLAEAELANLAYAEKEEELQQKLRDARLRLTYGSAGAEGKDSGEGKWDVRNPMSELVDLLRSSGLGARSEVHKVRKDFSMQSLVRKWGGTKDEVPVEEFLAQLRSIGKTGHWEDSDLVTICRLKLQGMATAFIEGHPELTGEGVTFPQLEAALKKRFADPKVWEVREEELRRCVQGPTESIREYADRVLNLGRRAIRPADNAIESAWLQNEGNKRTVKAFVQGLRRVVAKEVALRHPTTADEAIEMALEVEHTLRQLRYSEMGREGRVLAIDEVGPEPDLPADEVAAMWPNHRVPRRAEPRDSCPQCARRAPQAERGAPTSNPPTCFRCGQPGHMARFCKADVESGALQRTALPVCYRCQQTGHIARYCTTMVASEEAKRQEDDPKARGPRSAPAADRPN
ncbi:hypothetical protein GE061_001791 [Apolygus lucorum]|uniref:CCHC-type domain-containing protein n=1 Tax=Apolygus lucorum TaxID=248454 RepID=A0A8S9X2T6_APOLU|nr:hypothetical protein GE061_001791 [Apolygus lucorum]